MKLNRRLSNFFLASILCFPVVFSGCSGGEEKAYASPNSKPAVMAANVRTQRIETRSFLERIRLSGQTEAARDVTYSAEIAGRLESLTVDLGDRISKGQVIARIDYDMLKAQFDQAEAAFNLATKTYDRLQALLDDELVTQQQIDEANAQKIQANAQLRQAEAALRRSVVRSSNSGIVSGKFVDSGEYMMPGTPIIRVVDYSEIHIYAQVPETRVAEITAEAKVSAKIDALDQEFPSEIDVLVPVSDPESRTFTLRTKIQNADFKVLPGMAVTLLIETRLYENVIVIPQEIIVEQSDERFVFVIDNGKARKVNVELGPSENHTTVVLKGLSNNDELVVDGHRSLFDGQTVNIVN